MSRALIVLTHPRHQTFLEEIILRHQRRVGRFFVAALSSDGRLTQLDLDIKTKAPLEMIDPAQITSTKSDQELSQVATLMIVKLMASGERMSGWTHQNYKGISLIKACDNDIYTYGYRPLLSSIESLLALAELIKPDVIIALGSKELSFRFPERPDIDTLYDNETTFFPLIRAVAEHLGVPIKVHKLIGSLRANLFPPMRAALIWSYKFVVLASRVIRDRRARHELKSLDSKIRPKVVVIIRGASEFWTIRPVLEKMRTYRKFDYVIVQDDILKDPSARTLLASSKESYLPIHSCLSFAEFLGSFLRGLQLSSRFERAISRQSSSEPDPQANRSIHELILQSQPDFSQQLLFSMSKRFPEEVVFIEELSAFIKRFRPDLLITMSMVDNWGAIIKAVGDQFGIKTLAIQNAALSFLRLPTMVFADAFAVASQRQRDGMVALGADPDRIIVTGQPQYDPHLNRQIDQEAVRRSLDVRPGSKLLLITTQPTAHGENEVFVRAALEAVSGRSDVVCKIKLHPRERPESYDGLRAWIREHRLNAEVLFGQDVVELISASDLMISRFSTTIQSALMVGTPVIAYLAKEYQGFKTDYLETPAVIKTAELSELRLLITRALDDPAAREQFMQCRSEYLKTTVGVADGRASDRVLQLIGEMLGLKESEGNGPAT